MGVFIIDAPAAFHKTLPERSNFTHKLETQTKMDELHQRWANSRVKEAAETRIKKNTKRMVDNWGVTPNTSVS